MKKALLIYNPIAGRKKIYPAVDEVTQVLEQAYDVDVCATEKEKSAADIIRENKTTEYAAVFCCGGEGTLNDVINGVIKHNLDVAVGYIPCGSAHDSAKTLHIPTRAASAAKALLEGEVALVDVGCFNEDRYFFDVAAFGVLAKVTHEISAEEKNKIGHLAYLLHGIKEIFKVGKEPSYKVEMLLAEGRKMYGNYICGILTNSTVVGGVLKLPEDAVDVQDGLMEGLFIRKPRSDDEWMMLADDIIHQRLKNNPLIDFFHTSAITIRLPELDWSVDGEKVEGKDEVVIRNKRQLIKMILPKCTTCKTLSHAEEIESKQEEVKEKILIVKEDALEEMKEEMQEEVQAEVKKIQVDVKDNVQEDAEEKEEIQENIQEETITETPEDAEKGTEDELKAETEEEVQEDTKEILNDNI